MLWEAWKLSKAYSRTPAELYGVKDEYAAWCFNRAVFLFGTTLQNEIDAVQNKAKNERQARFKTQNLLNKWLYLPGEDVKGRFKDPAAMLNNSSARVRKA
jgi:Leucine-rich repeat (LRR) protein